LALLLTVFLVSHYLPSFTPSLVPYSPHSSLTPLHTSSGAWAPDVVAVCGQGKLISGLAHECLPDKRVLKEVQLRFPPFTLPMPRFVSSEDREWFLSIKEVREYINASLQCFQRPLPANTLCPPIDAHISPDDIIAFWTDRFVTGKNLILANGSFGEYKGCSWGVAHDLYLQRYPSFEGKTARRWGKLALMIVTQGWSFQHLIDGVLPRLMQAWDGLKADTEISVLVDYNDKFPIVPKIWEHLLGRERLVVFDRSVLFEADVWYQSCNSPPFHPYLWNRMREQFINQVDLSFEERSMIVYLGRGKQSGSTFNSGRSIVNEDELLKSIEGFVKERNKLTHQSGSRRPALELVVFNHANFANLSSTISFFNRAKVLIGPHGGSFYNMLFTPSYTLTIELMPIKSVPNLIIWQQASMLNHKYYLLAYQSDFGGNMEVDTKAIVDILRVEMNSA